MLTKVFQHCACSSETCDQHLGELTSPSAGTDLWSGFVTASPGGRASSVGTDTWLCLSTWPLTATTPNLHIWLPYGAQSLMDGKETGVAGGISRNTFSLGFKNSWV